MGLSWGQGAVIISLKVENNPKHSPQDPIIMGSPHGCDPAWSKPIICPQFVPSQVPRLEYLRPIDPLVKQSTKARELLDISTHEDGRLLGDQCPPQPDPCAKAR